MSQEERLLISESCAAAVEKLRRNAELKAKETELEQLEEFFVPLTCKISQSDTRCESLETVAQEFLNGKITARVCLLLGDAGTGKSTFCQMLEQQLFRGNIFIPVRIELKSFTAESAKTCVYNTLKAVLTEREVEEIKASRLVRLLFIFDGYDELSEGGFVNLWEANSLKEWGSDSKAIITCRPEYLSGHRGYKQIFSPAGQNGNNDNSCTSKTRHKNIMMTRYVSHLNQAQIEEYLRKLNLQDSEAKKEGSSAFRSKKPYELIDEFRASGSDLFELVNTPFLLKIFVKAFPVLLRKQGESAGRFFISLCGLYDSFMEAWFINVKDKFPMKKENSARMEKTFANFSCSLAFAMFKDSKNEVKYEEQASLDVDNDDDDDGYTTDALSSNKWSKWFSNADAKIVEARRGCPLRCIGGKNYSFVHLSFLEYFAAEFLWQVLQSGHKDRTAESWGARCPLKPQISQFMAIRLMHLPATDREASIEKLYDLISQTKSLSSAGQAMNMKSVATDQEQAVVWTASNAITVLNTACVPFTLKARDDPSFFCGIRVPYANLTMAELSGVDMSGSDLSHAVLTGAKLNHTKLTKCNLEGVELHEFPKIVFREVPKCIAFDQSGDLMAVASGNDIYGFRKTAGNAIWNPDFVLKGPGQGVVKCVAISADGELIVSGSSIVSVSSNDDHMLRIWRVDGSYCKNLPSHDVQHVDDIKSVAISPKNTFIVSGARDGTVQLWGFDGTSEPILETSKGPVYCVAISMDDKYIGAGTGATGANLFLWREKIPIEKGLESKQLPAIHSLAFSPTNSKLIAAGCADFTIKLWNIMEENGILLVTLGPTLPKLHLNLVVSVAFSSDGKRIAAGSHDNTISVWGVDGTRWKTLIGHGDCVKSVKFLPNNGKQLVSCGWDHTVRFWDLDSASASGPIIQGHSNMVTSVAFSPDGKSIVSGSGDSEVRLWGVDGSAGRVLRGHEGRVTCVAFSPDGCRIVSGGNDTTLRLWKMDGSADPVIMRGHSKMVTSVAFSPHGKVIASSAYDATVRLWSSGDGTLRQTMNGHKNLVSSVVFSPDGSTLVSGGKDGTLQFWSLADDTVLPEPVRVWSREKEWFRSVTFSPNGELIVSGSCKDKDKISTNNKSQRFKTQKDKDKISTNDKDQTFNNKDQLFEEDHLVRLWKKDGSLIFTKAGHERWITSVAFSPCGTFIVSGSLDNTIRIWNTDGSKGPTLKGHANVVSCVAISSEGKIVSGSLDVTVRLWEKHHDGNWLQLWSAPRTPALTSDSCQVEESELSDINRMVLVDPFNMEDYVETDALEGASGKQERAGHCNQHRGSSDALEGASGEGESASRCNQCRGGELRSCSRGSCGTASAADADANYFSGDEYGMSEEENQNEEEDQSEDE